MAEVFKSTHEHLLDIRLKPPGPLPPRSVSASIREAMGGPLTATRAIQGIVRGGGFASIGGGVEERFRTATTRVLLTMLSPFAMNQLVMVLKKGGLAVPKGAAGKGDITEASEEMKRQKGIFSHAFTEMGKNLRLGFNVLKGYVLAPFFDVVKNALLPLFNPLQDALISLAQTALIPLVQKVLPPLQDLFLNLARKFLPDVKRVGENVGTWLTTKIQRISGWLFREGGLDAIRESLRRVYSVVRGVVMGIINFFRDPAKMKVVHDILSKISITIGKFFSDPGNIEKVVKFSLALVGIGAVLKVVREYVTPLITSLFMLKFLFSGTGAGVKGLLTLLGGRGGLIGLAAAAGVAIGMLLDKLYGISDKLAPFFLKIWDKVLKPLGDFLGEFSFWLWDKVLFPIAKGISYVNDVIGSVMGPMYKFIFTKLGELASSVIDFWGWIINILQESWKVIEPIANLVIVGFQKMWEIIQPITSFIIDKLKLIFGWLESGVSKVYSFIRHPFITMAGGTQSSASPVKSYARGGPVESTGLAYVHKGEAVVPTGGSNLLDGTSKEMLNVLKDIRYANKSQTNAMMMLVNGFRQFQKAPINNDIFELGVA